MLSAAGSSREKRSWKLTGPMILGFGFNFDRKIFSSNVRSSTNAVYLGSDRVVVMEDFAQGMALQGFTTCRLVVCSGCA